MSKGVVHYKYYKKFRIVFLLIAVIFLYPSYFIYKDLLISIVFFLSIITGYYFIGNYVDPDFDLISITYGEGRMMRDFKVIGKLLYIYWVPYAFICQIFGGHRSWFSHGIMIGTIFRLMYLLIPFWIWFFYTGQDLYELEIVGFLGLWFGLGVADFIHIYLDKYSKIE